MNVKGIGKQGDTLPELGPMTTFFFHRVFSFSFDQMRLRAGIM
jgi:hypothetical protein